MSFISKLKSWMMLEDDEGDFEFMEQGTHELEPVELVQYAVNTVMNNAKEWPDGVDLPDVLEVWISPRDYDYFGLRKASCERRIADAIIRYAESTCALLERTPSVTLRVDPLLNMGKMRARAQFSDANCPMTQAVTQPLANAGACAGVKAGANGTGSGAATQPLVASAPSPQQAQPAASANTGGAGVGSGGGAGMGSAGGASANAGVPAAASASEPIVSAPAPANPPASADPKATPVFQPAGAPSGLTPEFKPSWMPAPPAAKLVEQGRQISVVAGDTIGCARGGVSSANAPAIALDEDTHPYVSTKQAQFTCENGVWRLVSYGRNGTSVQRAGVWSDLRPEVPFELRDNDRISFAHSEPLTFMLS